MVLTGVYLPPCASINTPSTRARKVALGWLLGGLLGIVWRKLVQHTHRMHSPPSDRQPPLLPLPARELMADCWSLTMDGVLPIFGGMRVRYVAVQFFDPFAQKCSFVWKWRGEPRREEGGEGGEGGAEE